MAQVLTTGADERLRPYLSARNDAESQRRLDALLRTQADPVIVGILRRHSHLCLPRAARQTRRGAETPEEQEAQDIRSEVLVQIIERLRECRERPDRRPIADLGGYVATATYHACSGSLRRRHRERDCLRARLRYYLARHPDYARWGDEAEQATALWGLASWRREGRTARAGAADLARAEARLRADAAVDSCAGRAATTADGALAGRILAAAGAPMRLEEITEMAARLLDLRERRVQPLPEGAEETLMADGRQGPAGTVERRAHLACLWGEIAALPRQQRVALLLNLRDGGQRGVLSLFVATGVATEGDVAAALGVPEGRMQALWEEMPVEDALIARMLGTSRQRVINLRASARKRLATRMALQEWK